MHLLHSPAWYGTDDVTISATDRCKIYYPIKDTGPYTSILLPHRFSLYPLVVFVHGQRTSQAGLCPTDITEDYTQWGDVLHLLARCGFVVVSPDVHAALLKAAGDAQVPAINEAAALVERVIRWTYSSWRFREVLFRKDVLAISVADASPPLGLMGHSFGGQVCAALASRLGSGPSPPATPRHRAWCIAAIATQWEQFGKELVAAQAPTLLLGGTNDVGSGPHVQPYANLPPPKHQAAILGGGHWDYFGPTGLKPCNTNTTPPPCQVGAQITSELSLGFFYKYLYNHWFAPPTLLRSPFGRPPLLQWFEPGTGCALKIRWHDPESTSAIGTFGEVTLGDWTESSPWG